jgi:hypothetical protein
MVGILGRSGIAGLLVSRSQRRRGRAYQPLPPRRGGAFWARAFVFFVAASLLLGTLLFVFGR